MNFPTLLLVQTDLSRAIFLAFSGADKQNRLVARSSEDFHMLSPGEKNPEYLHASKSFCEDVQVLEIQPCEGRDSDANGKRLDSTPQTLVRVRALYDKWGYATLASLRYMRDRLKNKHKTAHPIGYEPTRSTVPGKPQSAPKTRQFCTTFAHWPAPRSQLSNARLCSARAAQAQALARGTPRIAREPPGRSRAV